MYSGSNGLLDYYGLSARTEDRESTFIFDGVKSDGTPNDIVRGGPLDPYALENLHTQVLTNIDEYYIFDNSFVKLRELSLKYQPAKKLFKKVNIGVSVFTTKHFTLDCASKPGSGIKPGEYQHGGCFRKVHSASDNQLWFQS